MEMMLEQGDLVVERSMVRATHKGPFQSIAATGRKVTWTENNVYRVENGKKAEMWVCADLLGIVRKL